MFLGSWFPGGGIKAHVRAVRDEERRYGLYKSARMGQRRLLNVSLGETTELSFPYVLRFWRTGVHPDRRLQGLENLPNHQFQLQGSGSAVVSAPRFDRALHSIVHRAHQSRRPQPNNTVLVGEQRIFRPGPMMQLAFILASRE